MITQDDDLDEFKVQLRESLISANLNFTTLRIPKHTSVYLAGDVADSVYFIESGQLKLVMLSPEGKECLLAIHTAGDTFGESCLSGAESRRESAVTMEDTVLKRIACRSFFQHLNQTDLLEGFTQYLTNRIVEQQQLIATLLMVNSEHRLGETLLLLAHKLGQPDPRSTRIEQKITHEELSEMVGTTRPRITQFLRKFRVLGLIDVTPNRFLVIRQHALAAYLARTA